MASDTHDDSVDSGTQAVRILSASSSEVWLSATSTLYVACRLTDKLAGIETMVTHDIVRYHDGKHRLAIVNTAYYAEHVLAQRLADLESKVLG